MVALNVNDPRSGEDRRADVDAGMPWQLKAIMTVGVPSAIALFLVWSLANNFGIAQASTNKMLMDHIAVAPAMMRMLEEHKDSDIRLENYLRRICVNAARTAAERESCLSVR